MLTFNSKILTLTALSLVLYLMISSIDIGSRKSVDKINNAPINTEQRIKQIREKVSGKEKIAKEKHYTLQEKIVFSIIDYIMGEEFKEKFIKNG